MHYCIVRAKFGMRTCIPAQPWLCIPSSQWGNENPILNTADMVEVSQSFVQPKAAS